jgi:uncharacterized membrane protein
MAKAVCELISVLSPQFQFESFICFSDIREKETMMKFQLERIALFSDAVFAIAITLMMIEVKPPHLEHTMSFGEASMAFLEKLPQIIGTILSFILIGFFWMHHHRLMKYLKGYNTRLLWLNLIFLLSITFIPFSTTFVFENNLSFSPLPMVVYNVNYIIATFLSYVLFSYALNPKNGLATDEPDDYLRDVKRGLLFPISIYVAVIIIALINPNLAPAGYALFSFSSLMKEKKKAAVSEEPAATEPALPLAEEELA